jgi:integrase
MARQIHKLSPAAVKNAKPGMHADGGNLYLQATRAADGSISRSWIFRYTLNERTRHMGLGSLQSVTLAEAREVASQARRQLELGTDPIAARDAARAAAAAANAKQISFDECALAYVAAHRAGWRNVEHARQWKTTLATYASPIIGRLSVRDIDTGLVLKVLEPIWKDRTETASRLRGRIESVLDWARVRGYRSGENPARWRGHLDHLLPRRSKVQRVNHLAAFPYQQLPTLLKRIRAHESVAARALEFTILTAARTGEVRFATLTEIQNGVWVVPGRRMKSGREHRVPLCERAVEIINKLAPLPGPFIFAGRNGAIGQKAMLDLLRGPGGTVATVHGFRSAFRDWAAETTAFSAEVIEAALAHAIGNKTTAAYARGDLFEKRRRLMDAWANYCLHGKAHAEVVPLRLRGGTP